MSRKGQDQANNQVVVNVEIHRHGGIESAYGDEYSYGPVQKSAVIWIFCFSFLRCSGDITSTNF